MPKLKHEPLGSLTNTRAAIFQSRINVLGTILSLFFNQNPEQQNYLSILEML
jgi:hypothetical protein